MSDISKEARVFGQDDGVRSSNFDHAAGIGATTKKQKVGRHCKRWWWVYLLVLIAIVILVVCLM